MTQAQPIMPPRDGVRVQLSGVRRVFEGGVSAVDGIDLDVAAGSFVALLGPSGCRKSTLLRLIAGLDRPSTGSVSLSGSDDEKGVNARSKIAFVFQDPHLLPWRSVADNAALPLELAGVP